MTTPRSIPPADFAIVGLGRIGGGLARQALGKGLRVAGYSRRGPPAALREAGLVALDRLDALLEALAPPRVVLLYVPAGAAVDRLLHELAPLLDRGDVVADGGNSYWGDSLRRHARLAEAGLRFVDVGTSGGVAGALDGACFMYGAEADAGRIVGPLLERLAVAGGCVHAGGPGTGHFVKLVHNGIEFGMLQAIGEGVALLERHPGRLPIADILQTWRHGSVVRSWLVDLMAEAYAAGPGLGAVPPLVEDTGEVNWLVQDALNLGVPIPVITQAVVQLAASRDERGDAPRAIAAMRKGFGGHPYGRDEGVARERHEGRVGDFVAPPGTPAGEPSGSDEARDSGVGRS